MSKVYRDCSFNMSTRKMSDVMYAILMCSATLTSSFHLGISYNRKQNTYNSATIRIHIAENKIRKFEEFSGLKLQEPQQVGIN